MQAGPAHTVSAEREGGWVTSETGAGQNFIGNQYFVFSSPVTSVQVLAEMQKNTIFGRPGKKGKIEHRHKMSQLVR